MGWHLIDSVCLYHREDVVNIFSRDHGHWCHTQCFILNTMSMLAMTTETHDPIAVYWYTIPSQQKMAVKYSNNDASACLV